MVEARPLPFQQPLHLQFMVPQVSRLLNSHSHWTELARQYKLQVFYYTLVCALLLSVTCSLRCSHPLNCHDGSADEVKPLIARTSTTRDRESLTNSQHAT